MSWKAQSQLLLEGATPSLASDNCKHHSSSLARLFFESDMKKTTKIEAIIFFKEKLVLQDQVLSLHIHVKLELDK